MILISKPIFKLYYSWTFNMIDKHFWWWSSDSMWITHGIIIIIYLLLFHNKNISNALWTWHKKVFLLLTNWVLSLGEHNWIVSCTYFISNMKVEVCLKIFVCDFSHSQKNLVVAIITNLKKYIYMRGKLIMTASKCTMNICTVCPLYNVSTFSTFIRGTKPIIRIMSVLKWKATAWKYCFKKLATLCWYFDSL